MLEGKLAPLAPEPHQLLEWIAGESEGVVPTRIAEKFKVKGENLKIVG